MDSLLNLDLSITVKVIITFCIAIVAYFVITKAIKLVFKVIFFLVVFVVLLKFFNII